ncbi:exodeoxyribonuclease V subunit gamma [Marinobacterium jannaschii]|uniref:exodeoxyribonuclease V subunit gamma n=1 Tax=Marinobacterium jannaschii TaxID=64970 RepID=UPI0004816651|nr:exodeoxyribonuclease V subunit gamma [Marinobacterium jannaschii]
MFRIYHSNELDLLKDLLVEMVRREPLQDPFARETILVQSPGMAQWLKLELAKSLGIAASVDFPLPASFLWESFSQVLDGVPRRSAFEKEAMSWKLMQLLPDLLPREEFTALAQYLSDDQSDFKLYQLCGKIADLFDQYLVYRPDWIADWEQGGQMAAETQLWQPILWHALVQRSAELGQPHWHRANMYSSFVSALARTDAARAGLPERLFVFGISALPQNYVEALQAMGRKVDVHLMVTNPCQYYWGDIVDRAQIARISRRWFDKPGVDAESYFNHGNPILASMGKLGRDYLYLLQDLGADEIELFQEAEPNSLLSRVQKDILQLDDAARFPAARDVIESSHYKQSLQPDDRSISLHSCHSPLREVEVLHDQLLAMFERQPDLSPRDIIVMVPDVAAYAPYIEAVFANAPAERYLPFSISDRSAQQENPLLLSLLKLTSLRQSRFTVSEMLELLEVPAVLRRLELDEEDYHTLRRWISAVNIRWGLNSEHRSLLDLPLFEQNSWRFGLKRMLAGYAMGELDQLWDSIAPYSEVEGLEAALLGQLLEFIDLLERCQQSFSGDKPLNQWILEINQLLQDTYLADDDDEVAMERVRELLKRLAEQTADAAFDQPISAEILHDYLSNGLSSQRSSQRFMVGAINFCTLMPMRSIPFRVVCLLGMNDGDYPRSMPPLGFDLMSDQPRRGDRSRRDDDRYLFLEALLSARETLYISYVGRSIQDNSEKVPSVLVSELMEYCGQGYVLPEHLTLNGLDSTDALRRRLTTEHPLAPFSAAYFRQGSALFSYAREWLGAAAPQADASAGFLVKRLEADLPESLELSELQAFFRNPCRYFLNQRLKVYFRDGDSQTLDEEPFDLERLDDYLLKNRYLKVALEQGPLDRVDAQVYAEGLLPVAMGGQRLLAKLRHDCEELAEKVNALKEGEPQRRELRLDIAGLSLTAWIDGFYEDTLLRYRPSQVQAHDRINCWIEHLACSLAFPDLKVSYYRGLSGLVSFRPLPRDKAAEQLTQLVELYKEGRCRPIAFDPGCAWEYYKQLEKGEDKAQTALENRFNGGPRNFGALDDPYIRRIYPQLNMFETELKILVDQLIQPMQPWMEENRDD